MYLSGRWFLCIVIALAAPVIAESQSALSDLRMDTVAGGLPRGWGGGPPGTVFADSVVVRSSPYSGRIERVAGSPGEFSSLTASLPVRWRGETVTFSAWLRTKDVAGWAGLWMREDGPGGPVQFASMQGGNPVRGTTDWTRYTLRLPVDPTARRLYIGALVSGAGTAWLDDVELLVDDHAPVEAPPRAAVPAESDHEFDGGSGISTRSLTPVQVENLVRLGQVWGFVKYHHPRVARGEVNWDYELFRVLPGVLAAPDSRSADEVLVAWLEKIGAPTPCSPCARVPTESALASDVGWIRDAAALGTALSERLVAIHANRFAGGEQYYVGAVPGVRNPDFSAESAYPGRRLPDAGFRLLSLFRFWNIVQYWYPNRGIIGEDWTGVLREFVPRVMEAEDSVGYRQAMMRLIARVNDTHANLWSDLGVRPPRGSAQVPVAVRFVGGKAAVSGYQSAALGPATGLQRGDVIERIDGAPVDSLVRAWRPIYAASNEPTRLRDMAGSLLRGEPGVVRLSIRRGAKAMDLQVTRSPLQQLDPAGARTHERPGDAFQLLTDDVAYIKLSAAKSADVAGYFTRAAGTKVLVIDDRGYPTDFPIFAIGGHLVDRPTPFVRFTRADLANPGTFVWDTVISLQPMAPFYAGRVVVLVDEVTQSSAEYHSMAFRAAKGAIVVGSTTAGADGNVSPIALPGALRGMISGLGVFYPDRRPTQRVGIVPDLEVHPTIEGIRSGRDEVLEAGVSRALGRPFHLPVP